ncbi:hypothetical protein [Microcoleus sp. B4-D4]|uniref:hypothetical protein n=1 Tax=Microcoleus sp. B4-D4 TaxID=2818667 RepID=UPI002FD3C275
METLWNVEGKVWEKIRIAKGINYSSVIGHGSSVIGVFFPKALGHLGLDKKHCLVVVRGSSCVFYSKTPILPLTDKKL